MPVDSDAREFLAGLEREHRGSSAVNERTRVVTEQLVAAIQANHRANASGAGVGYNGGQITRLNQYWVPAHSSPDGAIAQHGSLLLARARDLERNNELASAAVDRIVENVLGPSGFDLNAAARIGEEELEDFNKEADDFWELYCDEYIDFEGELSFADMQELQLRETVTAGACIVLEVHDPDPSRLVPICFQLLEVEQMDDSQDRPATAKGNRIRGGIELNEKNRRVGYWLFGEHPNETQWGLGVTSKFYPASRVNYFYHPRRARQKRGVTWFATPIQRIRDLLWYLENELTASAVGALLTAVIKTEAGSGPSAAGLSLPGGLPSTDPYGNYLEALGPATIARIRPNESIEQIKSERPNNGAGPWTDLMVGLICMGLGPSRLALTKDYRGTTYSGARGNELADRKLWRKLQRWNARPWSKIRRRVIAQGIALGKFRTVTPDQFMRNPILYGMTQVHAPGWDWVDPTKEVLADLMAIAGGLENYTTVHARRGSDVRSFGRQRVNELKYFEKIGLKVANPLALATMLLQITQSEPGQQVNQPAEDKEEDGDDAEK